MANTRVLHMRFPTNVITTLEELLNDLNVSRNEFIVQAVREKISREMRLRGLKETRGSLGPEDAPEWTGEEKQRALSLAQAQGALEIARGALPGPEDSPHHDEVLYR